MNSVQNLVGLKSLLFNLSLSIDAKDFNETTFYNWAIQGFKKVMLRQGLQPEWFELDVYNHHAAIPSNLVAINQMIKVINKDCYELILKSPNLVRPCLPNCECVNLYSVKNGRIVFSFDSGKVLLLGFKTPVNESGELLVPDDVELIEAIEHYVKYKYYDSKLVKDNIIINERTFNLRRFTVLSAKVRAKFILPSLDELENIKNLSTRLLSSNAYNNFFSSLGLNEKIDYVK